MTNRKVVSLVTGVLILSVLLPVVLSVWLAHYQAEKTFIHDLNAYSERVITRTQKVADQARKALATIGQFQGTPCSPPHLQAMRQLSYTFRDVQEVLWLEGRRPICSSLESNNTGVEFPATDMRTHDGYRVWLTSENDLGIQHYMAAIASGPYMVMIDPVSFVDVVPFNGWSINAALIVSRTGQVIARNHPFDISLWQQSRAEGSSTFEHNGMVYDRRDYPDLGVSLLVWASTRPLDVSWHRQLQIWLPVGILMSLLGAALILRMLRRLQSPYHRMLDAINAGDIQVFYQPIVDLENGKIVGAEALARWPQTDGSWLSPDIFIPLAEQTGLITRLTTHVVEKCFADLGAWLHAHPDQHISINLCAADLGSASLRQVLEARLQRWHVAPSQVALELTERSFVDPQRSGAALSHYRQAGHPLYIDDFGTGYSSLSYLQDLDVDIIKIDKSFVDALEYKPVTPHIIEMAKTLHLSMVAEGVETEAQREWLQQHGVQYAQGWLYSKALPPADFIAWADSNLSYP